MKLIPMNPRKMVPALLRRGTRAVHQSPRGLVKPNLTQPTPEDPRSGYPGSTERHLPIFLG